MLADREDYFNGLPWHDSQLLGVTISASAEEEKQSVVLDLAFRAGREWRVTAATFRECTIVQLDLDLDGMRVCGHSINTARCLRESPLKEQLTRTKLKYEDNPLDDYYHFRIAMINPGGELNIVAKDCQFFPVLTAES